MSQRPASPFLAQAVAHHRAGRFDEAARLYRSALALDPEAFEPNYLLGVLRAGQGALEEAAGLLGRACARQPRHADAQFQYGSVLLDLGRPGEAVKALERAIAVEPRLAPAHSQLARALGALDRLDDAARAYGRALALEPGQAAAHYNLANIEMRRGDRAAAIASYRRALALRPDHARAQANLAAALELDGDMAAATWAWLAAARLEPDNASSWQGFARGLRGVRFETADLALAPDLLRALTHPAVDPDDVAAAAVSFLSATPTLRPLLAEGDGAGLLEAWPSWGGTPAGCLFAALLQSAIVADPAWERLLIAVRGALLARAGAHGGGPADLACAVAHQAFASEYVQLATPAERDASAALRRRIESGAESEAFALAVLAAYMPLHALANAADLAERAWPEPLAALIARQIAEPRLERAIAAAIACLTPIDDRVSRAVRAQYEANPYPRWVRAAWPGPARPLREIVRELFPCAAGEGSGGAEVLIAGCGTGRQVVNSAQRYAGARVLAVDLSLASLAYAQRKAAEAGLANVTFAQADILGLATLDRCFDLIECGGVLHHMDDPLAAWRVLEGLLKPGGFMRIALYSERARAPVVAARSLIAAGGFGDGPDGIRAARHAILASGDEDLARAFARNPDFYSLSGCRDLLFHVHERRMTLPGIAAMLDALGLRFLGFEGLPAAAVAAYRARFPDDAAMTALECWDAFEAAHPRTFVGMYQFWAAKPAPQDQ